MSQPALALRTSVRGIVSQAGKKMNCPKVPGVLRWIEEKSKSPPFDFAQGRLSRKEREKWGTRLTAPTGAEWG